MNILPPSFKFDGDKDKATSYKAYAGQFYKLITTQAAKEGVPHVTRTKIFPDGTIINFKAQKNSLFKNWSGSVSIFAASSITPPVLTGDYWPYLGLDLRVSGISLSKSETGIFSDISYKYKDKAEIDTFEYFDTRFPIDNQVNLYDTIYMSEETYTSRLPYNDNICFSKNYDKNGDIINFTGVQSLRTRYTTLGASSPTGIISYRDHKFSLGSGICIFDARVERKKMYVASGTNGTGSSSKVSYTSIPDISSENPITSLTSICTIDIGSSGVATISSSSISYTYPIPSTGLTSKQVRVLDTKLDIDCTEATAIIAVTGIDSDNRFIWNILEAVISITDNTLGTVVFTEHFNQGLNFKKTRTVDITEKLFDDVYEGTVYRTADVTPSPPGINRLGRPSLVITDIVGQLSTEPSGYTTTVNSGIVPVTDGASYPVSAIITFIGVVDTLDIVFYPTSTPIFSTPVFPDMYTITSFNTARWEFRWSNGGVYVGSSFHNATSTTAFRYVGYVASAVSGTDTREIKVDAGYESLIYGVYYEQDPTLLSYKEKQYLFYGCRPSLGEETLEYTITGNTADPHLFGPPLAPVPSNYYSDSGTVNYLTPFLTSSVVGAITKVGKLIPGYYVGVDFNSATLIGQGGVGYGYNSSNSFSEIAERIKTITLTDFGDTLVLTSKKSYFESIRPTAEDLLSNEFFTDGREGPITFSASLVYPEDRFSISSYVKQVNSGSPIDRPLDPGMVTHKGQRIYKDHVYISKHIREGLKYDYDNAIKVDVGNSTSSSATSFIIGAFNAFTAASSFSLGSTVISEYAAGDPTLGGVTSIASTFRISPTLNVISYSSNELTSLSFIPELNSKRNSIKIQNLTGSTLADITTINTKTGPANITTGTTSRLISGISH